MNWPEVIGEICCSNSLGFVMGIISINNGKIALKNISVVIKIAAPEFVFRIHARYKNLIS
jgi:hypothetical protein